MRIAYPTTAAQYFHLLRRQALLLVTDPLPLIVMSPKSLLRHPLSGSSLRELTDGKWQPVLDDPLLASGERDRALVERLILCSGKIYVDLVSSEQRQQTPHIAIARVEQLYPFPAYELEPLFAAYPNLQEIVWVQEEPRNMGAWSAAKPQLETITQARWPIRYIGRPRRANPAEGSAAWHKVKQAEIVEQALSQAD
jgi:2-oxoglutarate dehydrogenase E1 component